MPENFARSIWAINKAGQAFFADRMASRGLGAGQYPLLSVLFMRDCLSQEEIAGLLRIDKAAVAKSVRKLIDEGYADRTGDEADGRMKRVRLTAKARKAKPALEAIEAEWRSILLSGFGEAEAETLRGYLKRLAANAARR
jgi:MarR family transcriptional regulator, organic hydroperoxide resistance regulator